jgi:hypothetical protein
VRTLVVSDLHLGARTRVDVLRRPAAIEALARAADGARVVLLGDVLELRHGPVREALQVAEPAMRAVGEAAAEVVLVPGNHDHRLVRPWLEARGALDEPAPLALDERVPGDGTPGLERLTSFLGDALEVRYPGVWLRPDVFATHGHQLDVFTTVPAFERLGIGAIARIWGAPVPDRATPDDLEAALAPLYALLDASAERRGPGVPRKGSVKAWELLSKDGRRWRGWIAVPLVLGAITAINRAGIGPVRAEFTAVELRRAGVLAMREALRRLGVDAPHVVFGHTHRAGPRKGDDPGEWGPLWNAGCWVHEPSFTKGGPGSPYWPGRAVVVEDEGPPRLVGLLDDVPVERLRA